MQLFHLTLEFPDMNAYLNQTIVLCLDEMKNSQTFLILQFPTRINFNVLVRRATYRSKGVLVLSG